MNIKKSMFMLRKLLRDFNANRRVIVNMNTPPGKLGYYYIKFEEKRSKLNRLIHSLDEEGIPLNTTYIDVTPPRLHYYPISIGQYGLALFHSWIETGNVDKREHFLRVADWFARNKREEKEQGVYWLTDVPKPEFGVFTPWKSAFVQGRGISILTRAWQLTGNDNYLHLATSALLPFTKDISEGGVSVDRTAGETFYEEYVATAPTRVLDGHAFSLFGLLDYARAVPDTICPEGHRLARGLFDEGIEGLIRQLPRFDLGFWLRFNRCDIPGYPKNDPCTIGYLRLVRWQLIVLHHVTGREELLHFARKCEHYDTFPNILKMYYLKLRALKKLDRL
ncbi:MAG: D-glucuronyl C5-epimerase family protein [Odoribacteraceae bacterium]|jgi:hypothetical protein|nr:D-glucuronyl C5-epimerase family protein [Odoribacteraceae bacterium]